MTKNKAKSAYRLARKSDNSEKSLPISQAQRVFRKFGGPARLSHILKAIGRPKTYTALYFWDYPLEKGGGGGLIPSKAWPDIFIAARWDGIVLTPEDVDPRPYTEEGDSVKQLTYRSYPKRIRKKPL